MQDIRRGLDVCGAGGRSSGKFTGVIDAFERGPEGQFPEEPGEGEGDDDERRGPEEHRGEGVGEPGDVASSHRIGEPPDRVRAEGRALTGADRLADSTGEEV